MFIYSLFQCQNDARNDNETKFKSLTQPRWKIEISNANVCIQFAKLFKKFLSFSNAFLSHDVMEIEAIFEILIDRRRFGIWITKCSIEAELYRVGLFRWIVNVSLKQKRENCKRLVLEWKFINSTICIRVDVNDFKKVGTSFSIYGKLLF